MSAAPLPCLVCGSLPKVDGFPLMTGRTGWTALCPNHCYESATYYDRGSAVADWNLWVESEGEVYQGEEPEWWDDDEEDG